MVHDNKNFPLKGMKASRLPKIAREKTQYSSTQLENARQMILEQAEKMGLIKEDDTWPEHLEKEFMYFRDSQTLKSAKGQPKKDVVSNMKQSLAIQNKLIDKEIKKCGKYGQALDVMFKKYQLIAQESGSQLT